jgi:hypothetical protein
MAFVRGLIMSSFADVCLCEQESKTIHAEMQEAERRYRTARHEKVNQMTKLLAEVNHIRDLFSECSDKFRNAENTSVENKETLRQELNSLSIKKRQLSQNFEQIYKECNMILHDDMDFLPTWLELRHKHA